MTKKELKKEAIQYAVDYPTSYGKGYKHKDLRVAYLAGAEPREKRISKLEKENTELKARLIAINLLTPELEKQSKARKKQLAEAKELIEDIYDLIPSSHSDYYKDVMERARQFLKKVEK